MKWCNGPARWAKFTLRLFSAGLFFWALLVTAAQAAAEQQSNGQSSPAGSDSAQVILDGRVILEVRGTSAFTAERRADQIKTAIVAVAEDESIGPEDIRLDEQDARTFVTAGKRFVLTLFDEDAALGDVSRTVLAQAVQLRLQDAIRDYRLDRTPGVLIAKSLYALAATFITIGLFFGFRIGFRRLDRVLEQHMRNHLKALETQSARFIKAQQLAQFLRGPIKALHLVLGALALYFYLNFVLGLYPWTRGFAEWLFDLILSPLQTIGSEVLASVPNLVFLVILFFVTRYVLKMIQAFFRSIDRGVIQLTSFEQEWAWPTYRILRLLVIIAAVVVGYPYIPGSDSEAFKGISILLGLIVSLGSSSIIANIIAGYSMAYRRPFKIGDRIKINDTIGDVVEIRVLVTRLRSLKNEEIVIPNTSILNSEVVNYSALGEQEGLILHTRVGIGYETPWRQVEAMLKQAADRTSGLLKKAQALRLADCAGGLCRELRDQCLLRGPEEHDSDPLRVA